MKVWTGVILAFAFCLGFGASTPAQNAPPSHEADHAALRTLMTNVTEAINKQDLDALSICFARDFVFTAVDQTVLTNAASVKDYYKRMVQQDDSPVTKVTVEPKADILTRFIDANTGYCHGTTTDTYTLRKGKRSVAIEGRWTAVVVKEEGKWKMAAVHSGVNFMDNPVLETASMGSFRRFFLFLGFGRYPGEQ